MANKIRLYELAKELKKSTQDLLNILDELKIPIKNSLSALDDDTIKLIKDKVAGVSKAKKETKVTVKEVKETKTVKETKKEEKPKPEKVILSPHKKETEPTKKEIPASVKKEAVITKKVTTTTNKEVITPNKEIVTPKKEIHVQKKEIITPKKEVHVEKKEIKKEEKVEHSVNKLSKLCNAPKREIELKLLKLGIAVKTYNDILPNFAVKDICALYEVVLSTPLKDTADEKTYATRAPVITVMGHVDHGKTTLLDTIRKTRVAERELGGITQKIGAYEVNYENNKIVFIDTPGHEAFTSMRSKGAEVTDIVVLVVAADEGVKDQTIEAINHAKAARVPIIVALNKMDKENTNVDGVKNQLSDHGLLPEEWGGETIYVNISAKNNTGIDDLLEMISIKAELMELKTNTKSDFAGTVIESVMSKSFGGQATLIIQTGKLSIGDMIGYENEMFKIRAMFNDLDKSINKAEALTPVKITGLPLIIKPGTILKAKNLLTFENNENILTSKNIKTDEEFNLDDQYLIEDSKETRLNVIIKADGEGTLDAVAVALSKINIPGTTLNILHKGVGMVTDADVLLAGVSKALIVGFNVTSSDEARKEGKNKSVDIRNYRIIFDLIEDVKKGLEGKLKPEETETILGTAEVKQPFKVSKVGTIAGCIVKSGTIVRNARVRLIRNRAIHFDSKISSLKRFKEDIKEVREGFECGIGIENFNDIKSGDILEVYEIIQKK